LIKHLNHTSPALGRGRPEGKPTAPPRGEENSLIINGQHVGLVSNPDVLNQIIDLITFETGITADISQVPVDIAA